jgi:hypothetical protein
LGAWFRVVVPPGKEGTTLLGFIASNEVEIIEETTVPKRDFWAPEEGTFRGLGFDLVFDAGFVTLGSGDLKAGVRGRYDELVDSVQAFGYNVIDKDVRAFGSGIQAAAEAVWNLDSRLGFGIGGEYVYGRRLDKFGYMVAATYFSAASVSTLDILILGPKIHYTIPLSRVVSLRLNGGPAVFLANFKYDWSIILPGWEKSYYQRAHKAILGAQGGAALEFKLNKRTALFVQAAGRYAKSTDVAGEERDLVLWMGIDVSGPEMKGPLYFLPGGPYPRLAVRPEAPGGDARKARFDLSGVSLSLGLRVKF